MRNACLLTTILCMLALTAGLPNTGCELVMDTTTSTATSSSTGTGGTSTSSGTGTGSGFLVEDFESGVGAWTVAGTPPTVKDVSSDTPDSSATSGVFWHKGGNGTGNYQTNRCHSRGQTAQ